MLTKNGGVLLPIPGPRARASILGANLGVRQLVAQVIFITPLFWLMELLQNQVYLAFSHAYGWRYRDAQGQLTAWYSFESLMPWAITVAVFSLLDAFAFEPWRLSLVLRMLIAGAIGWCGEWLTGAFFDHVLGHCLQIWPGSGLVYVAPSALPFWIFDFAVFHVLVRELRRAQDR
jgi:hypothetical protein